MARVRKSATNTVVKKFDKAVESESLDVGQVGTASVGGALGEIKASYENSTIETTANVVGLNDHADQLAFLNETLIINIMESVDEKNPEPVVFLAVNGIGAGPHNTPYVPRGVDIQVKRFHVEKLARAKRTSYDNKEITVDGERKFIYPSKTALQYPFTVLHDPNPRGAQWLKQLLAER